MGISDRAQLLPVAFPGPGMGADRFVGPRCCVQSERLLTQSVQADGQLTGGCGEALGWEPEAVEFKLPERAELRWPEGD